MKIFLTLFVLLFSSSVFAEDISDFEIEGMSLGDSLLDHYSLKEINNAYLYKYKNDEYRYYTFVVNSRTYDYLQITIKTDNKNIKKASDKKMEIYSIAGIIEYVNNFDDCYKKQDEIKEELEEFFKTDGIIGSKSHPMDKTGKSIIRSVDYYLKSAGYPDIGIDCIDWSKEIEDQGFKDSLKIAIFIQEFLKFIYEEEY